MPSPRARPRARTTAKACARSWRSARRASPARERELDTTGRTSTVRLVITHGTLIDGTGAPPRPNTAIVIEGTDIVEVDATHGVSRVRPDDHVIDATGQFIMPGLIDGHVHLSSHQGALPGVRHTSS